METEIVRQTSPSLINSHPSHCWISSSRVHPSTLRGETGRFTFQDYVRVGTSVVLPPTPSSRQGWVVGRSTGPTSYSEIEGETVLNKSELVK